MFPEITGLIIEGEGIGSKISYPTINILIPREEENEGVYVCRVLIEGMGAGAAGGVGAAASASAVASAEFFGAGYVGEKKGLADDEFICEVFLFGDPGDVYGKVATVEFLKKIRDVQKVKNLEELSVLIDDDVKFSKKWLETWSDS